MLARGYEPPFNPCSGQDISNALNFESEFRNLPLHSMDQEKSAFRRQDRITSDTFRNFSFESPATLDPGMGGGYPGTS